VKTAAKLRLSGIDPERMRRAVMLETIPETLPHDNQATRAPDHGQLGSPLETNAPGPRLGIKLRLNASGPSVIPDSAKGPCHPSQQNDGACVTSPKPGQIGASHPRDAFNHDRLRWYVRCQVMTQEVL